MHNKLYKLKYLTIIITIIVGYFFLYYSSSSLDGFTFCIFKAVTGLPCPACGSTRATVFLLHYDLYSAFLFNPLAIITNICILISVFWMIVDIIFSRQSFFKFLKMNWPMWLKIIAFSLILLNWIWNIYKGL